MNKALKTFLVVGARPNYMKMAPVWREMMKRPESFCPVIVHTGQHYDHNMSDAFFSDFDLPAPDFFLGVGSGTHSGQTAKIMMEIEPLLQKEQPEILIVVGDVNSTLGCALAAGKLRYNNGTAKFNHPFVIHNLRPLIVHIEAGLRSFDRTMPEEINRIITDALSDVLFTPSPDADENLRKEGIKEEKISYVGNIMIDALEFMRPKINAFTDRNVLDLMEGDYGLITIHRPFNVDDRERLAIIAQILLDISHTIKIIFPVHPRTKQRLEENGLLRILSNRDSIRLLEPMPYLKFMTLLFNCKFVLSDSGGLQEETTYLGKPCLTLRPNTERPITVSSGTNELVDIHTIHDSIHRILNGSWKKGTVPKYWDGQCSGRIIKRLLVSAHK